MGWKRKLGWTPWGFLPVVDIINPSFEASIPSDGNTYGWTAYDFGSGFGSYAADTVNRYHGLQSINIGAGGYAYGRGVRQDIKIAKWRGRTVQITCRSKGLKTSNVGLYVSCDGTPAGSAFDNPAGDNTWELLTTSLNVPHDATYIRIAVRHYEAQYGPSYTRFDDVRISAS